jgi:hypothetical protein
MLARLGRDFSLGLLRIRRREIPYANKTVCLRPVHPNIINEVLVFRSVNKVIHHPAMVTLLQLLTADLRPLICDLSSPFYRRQLVAIFPDQPW